MKLKHHITACLFLFILFILISCKKDEPTPEGGNKIEIGTTTIDNYAYQTATISTMLTSTGDNKIIQHGHCWSTEPEPGVNDDHTSLGSISESKLFTSNLQNLEPNTTYYFRAYITTSNVSVYGDEKELRTLKTGKPVIVTAEVLNITAYTAECGGEVVNDSGLVVTACGVCWNKTGDPTIDNSIAYTTDSLGTGNFASEITDLEESISYFISAYATNEKGTSYGEVKTFNTIPLVLPTVSTDLIDNITTSSARYFGTVSNEGNGTVSIRGICWDTSPDLIIGNCLGFTENGTGLGDFTGDITELVDGTIYYTKAYAINEKGTGYGEVKSFQTIPILIPEVETNDVNNITTNSVQCGGNVLNEGNGTVAARGVCWNTTGNPSLENCLDYTNDGGGSGSFISNISGLTEGTNYFVRAYATNEKGTACGDERSFVTEVAPCGELTINYGGQVYHTVEINDQCWFKENLNIGTRINGTQDQQNNSTLEKYCYDDNQSRCDEYGGLYQWDEAMQYVTTQGAQGICPDGWHIPSDSEWGELVDYLGGSGVAGGKMKEVGYVHWSSPNTGATNSSGFTGLPAGGRSSSGGSFNNVVYRGYFWSSTEGDASGAWRRTLFYNSDDVWRYDAYETSGYSVRCLQDGD